MRSFYIRFGKRLLDLSVATVALCLLFPVLAFVALIVRFTMGAPTLVSTAASRSYGAPFVILKFRTMRDQVEAAEADRLESFGRALRATSLDELPQLVNVLRGDMSLVGPRPLLMQYLQRYSPEQARRHEARPGVSGWAQVNGRNTLSWDEKLAMDVWYVDHQSLWLDLKIMARTIAWVVRGRGINAPGEVTVREFLGSER